MSKNKRSWNMGRIRSEHTKPEIILRHLLHRSGIRFRINYSKLPGSPDIVLPKYKTVIFVHGCFWHRHPGCSKATMPNTNKAYWRNKFDKNILRDIEIRKELIRLKWRVWVVWECKVMADPLGVAESIIEKLDVKKSRIYQNGTDRKGILKIAEKRSLHYLNDNSKRYEKS